ncbi:MAG: translation initiation factor IF-3 [Verrucomicrobiota bacterium]
MRGKNVRLVSEDNDQIGVVTFEEAMERAENAGQNLVLVAPQASPPVCRIMDYGKFQYEKSKKEHQARKRQHQQKLKEIKFHPNIDDHDFQTKINHAVAFLEKGNKVRVSMFLRGREMAHQDLGFELMKRVAAALDEHGKTDQPRKQGRMIIMNVSPRTATNK